LNDVIVTLRNRRLEGSGLFCAAPYISSTAVPKILSRCAMWNREKPVKATPAIPAAPEPQPDPLKEIRAAHMHIGRSVWISGQVSGAEDLAVDGRLEGRIDLPDHAVTIGPNARVKADIVAKVVTVFGSVVGSVTAFDKTEIRRGGSLQGDLICGRIAMQDGAHFCGKVEMGRREEATTKPQKAFLSELVAV
jgi:cytoskeletal protein CcmA (bactofilin family)